MVIKESIVELKKNESLPHWCLITIIFSSSFISDEMIDLCNKEKLYQGT